jgi:hypothetical protein
VVALPAVRAGEVDRRFCDFGAATQLNARVAVLLIAEGETDILEAGRETNAAASGEWRVASGAIR